jgi:hypothetical protein
VCRRWSGHGDDRGAPQLTRLSGLGGLPDRRSDRHPRHNASAAPHPIPSRHHRGATGATHGTTPPQPPHPIPSRHHRGATSATHGTTPPQPPHPIPSWHHRGAADATHGTTPPQPPRPITPTDHPDRSPRPITPTDHRDRSPRPITATTTTVHRDATRGSAPTSATALCGSSASARLAAAGSAPAPDLHRPAPALPSSRPRPVRLPRRACRRESCRRCPGEPR